VQTPGIVLPSLFVALFAAACGGGGPEKAVENNWPDDAEGPAGSGGGVRVFAGEVATLSAARACTHEAGVDADRWCAFVGRSGAGEHNLFVVNVSQVIAGVAVDCQSEDPNCLLLTADLEGSSADNHPTYFAGDTLVYYDDDFSAYVWRPRMDAGRLLAQRTDEHDIALCSPAQRGPAVACLAMPFAQPAGELALAELYAGSAEGAEEPLLAPIAEVIPRTAEDNVTVHRFGFGALADGYVAWSSRETETGVEILKLSHVDDPKNPLVVAEDVHRWSVTDDGSSWLWLSATNDGAVGTLQIADFPDGSNPVDVLPGVIDYELTKGGSVVAETEQRTAVSIVDPSGAPEQQVVLGGEVERISALSDLGQVAFAKAPVPRDVTDFVLSSLDGERSCVLDTSGGVRLGAVHFSPGGDGVLWAAPSSATGKVDAYHSRLEGCETETLAPAVAVLGWVGPHHAVFIDEFDPDTVAGSLRYRKAGRDGRLHPDSTLIAEEVDTYATWGSSFILYTISTGGEHDGMYVRAFGR